MSQTVEDVRHRIRRLNELGDKKLFKIGDMDCEFMLMEYDLLLETLTSRSEDFVKLKKDLESARKELGEAKAELAKKFGIWDRWVSTSEALQECTKCNAELEVELESARKEIEMIGKLRKADCLYINQLCDENAKLKAELKSAGQCCWACEDVAQQNERLKAVIEKADAFVNGDDKEAVILWQQIKLDAGFPPD